MKYTRAVIGFMRTLVAKTDGHLGRYRVYEDIGV
jgi:hypothetical protein